MARSKSDAAGELIRRAGAGDVDPVAILVSSQPLLVDRVANALLDAAVPPAHRGFNLDVVQGKGASGRNIVAMLETLPMMAPRRAVLVRDIAAMAAAELAHVLGYLDRPNPTSVFIATAAKVDKRVKFYSAANKKKVLHTLEAPRRLAPWVKAEAKGRGIALGSGAADRLVDVVGSDLARLSLVLDQLSLYAGDRPVSVDDVDDLVAETRERSVFELTDSIGGGDLPRALAAVTALCDQRQSAIGVIAMLARHMRQLGKARVAIDRGVRPSQLSRELGVPPFIADKIARQAERFSPRSVSTALTELADADAALKGFTQLTKTLGRDLGERVVLDRLVTTIVGLAR